jgi:diguanylate cyclase (GGDEF)-like protein/PAS domain S-box-containing protein
MDENSAALPFGKVLMEGIQDMVFIMKVGANSYLTYEFLNKAAMENTGWDKGILGKTFREAHTGKKALWLEGQYYKALASTKDRVFEDNYCSAEGEWRYSLSRLIPILNEEKQCTHIVGIVKDTTAEKRAEAEKVNALQLLEERASHFSSLFDNNGDAIFTVDLEGEIRNGNPAVEKISGHKMETLIGRGLADYLAAGNQDQVPNYMEYAKSSTMKDFRVSLIHASGNRIGCLMKLVAIKVQSEIRGYYVILKDMTELDKMVSKYADSEERFRIIAENAQDVIILLNEAGETVYASPSCETVYGFKPAEAIAAPPFSTIHPNDTAKLEHEFELSIVTGQACRMRLRVAHKTKGWVWSELYGTPVFDDQKNFIHKVLILRDITQQRKRESELEYFAYHDSLTGLPNRRLLADRLSKEIETGTKFAIMVLDIDDFKKINDGWGHEVGDAVIQEFGKRLSDNIGASDFASRLGGDEFVALLFDADTEEKARAAADKIQRAMEDPWVIKSQSFSIAASIGIALAPFKGADVSSIFQKADYALYEVKKSGKNYFKIDG